MKTRHPLSDLDADIRDHIERETQDNIGRGMTPEEARYAALRKFGNATLSKEDVRAVWIPIWVDQLQQDLRYTARMLRRHYRFTVAALLMLALGVGTTTAMFSVVYGVLIKPLPYPDQDALVSVVHLINGRPEPFFSDVIYATYRENNQTFEEFGVWSPYAGTASVTGEGTPEEVRALGVTHGLLGALGLRPELGRLFSEADDRPGANDTVILTASYWQQRFGGDRAVLERTITINARPHQIIGVTPDGFRFAGERDVILPLRINRARPVPAFRLLGVARLKPGVTLTQANADVARMIEIWRPILATGPFSNTRYETALRPFVQDVVGDVGRTLWIVMGTLAIVLLMACANVANLLLVRADARQQEFAIRVALGAGGARLARAFLVEGMMVALMGGALGVAAAHTALRIMVATGPAALPRLSELSIDLAVFSFALVVSLSCGLLFGFIPMVKHAGRRFATATVTAARTATLPRERQRSQQMLVTIQMALALVLLVSSGLMIRTFMALRNVNPGFSEPAHVQTFTLTIPETEVADAERVTRLQHEILDKIGAISGVSSVAFTTRLPMDTTPRMSFPVTIEGQAADGRRPISRQTRFVSPGLFQTLGTSLVGRDFSWTDIYDKRDVVIVSETLARELWGSSAQALGRRIRQGSDGPWSEVIGIAGRIHDEGADRPPTATIFFPARLHRHVLGLAALLPRGISFAVRSERADTESFFNELHRAVWSINANLPLARVRTLDNIYGQSMARTSFTLILLAIAGAMALLLGISGIYGVIAYAVSQRRREIGIRLALGAQARDVIGLFVRQSVLVTSIGATIGLAGALASTRLMESLLFGVSPLDPVTFVATPLVLAAAALMASYLPARRALLIDPVETIRAE